MRLVGILRAYDSGKEAKLLADYLCDEPLENGLRDLIINYLKGGELVAGVMEWWSDFEDYDESFSEIDGGFDTESDHYDEDDDDENARSIGPAGYYSDGQWLWAGYLVYYLEKYPNFKIDEEFLEYMKSQNFEIPKLSEKQIEKAENFFDVELFGNINTEESE